MPDDKEPLILVVDDDHQVQKLLSDYLGKSGFRVMAAHTQAELYSVLESAKPQLIVLDLNLPDGLGFDIVRDLRGRLDTPIIMLTGSKDEYDRIVGLEVGADDYISKPFVMREMLARIRAVLRRYQISGVDSVARDIVRFANWTLDCGARTVRHADSRAERLTDQEFRLLSAFIEAAGRVVSRDYLLDASGAADKEVFDRSIDYHVMKLRRKLEDDPRKPRLIKTERNAGYLFDTTPVKGK